MTDPIDARTAAAIDELSANGGAACASLSHQWRRAWDDLVTAGHALLKDSWVINGIDTHCFVLTNEGVRAWREWKEAQQR